MARVMEYEGMEVCGAVDVAKAQVTLLEGIQATGIIWSE
jgi:hypothetical protein